MPGQRLHQENEILPVPGDQQRDASRRARVQHDREQLGALERQPAGRRQPVRWLAAAGRRAVVRAAADAGADREAELGQHAPQHRPGAGLARLGCVAFPRLHEGLVLQRERYLDNAAGGDRGAGLAGRAGGDRRYGGSAGDRRSFWDGRSSGNGKAGGYGRSGGATVAAGYGGKNDPGFGAAGDREAALVVPQQLLDFGWRCAVTGEHRGLKLAIHSSILV